MTKYLKYTVDHSVIIELYIDIVQTWSRMSLDKQGTWLRGERTPYRTLKFYFFEKRPMGRPRLCWVENIEFDAKDLGEGTWTGRPKIEWDGREGFSRVLDFESGIASE